MTAIDLATAASGLVEETGMSTVESRASELYAEQRKRHFRTVNKMFLWLMLGQWIFAIVIAVTFSPYAWSGKEKTTHIHVTLAVVIGAALLLLPAVLVKLRPDAAITRHVIAVNQMLWSALLIHLTGGRIETHFHVFGSLAFLAFYLDWPVLITATAVVIVDHLLRGLLWPESVYGITNPEWWRFLEHAFWVVFEDVVLLWACIAGTRELRAGALRQAEVEKLSESEQNKAAALAMLLEELKTSSSTA